MHQRSVGWFERAWVSSALAVLLTAGCLPTPVRVSPTAIGKEGTLKTNTLPGSVGRVGPGNAALPGAIGLPQAVAAPIISNNGANVLKGVVRVPASIISHNGGNIVSNNGGTIISHNGGNIISHNGGNIISHNGGNVRIAQVPLAFTTVRLKDAAGLAVKDAQGQELVTKTDASGNYAFPVDVTGRNLVIEADVEGQAGKLKSLLPKEGLQAGKGLDVDLTSTLTLAYILDQYVKGDLATFERLPKDIEAKARVATEVAIVEKHIELPKTLEAGAIVAKVDEVRKAAPQVDGIFEEIRKILMIAGIVREGDGLKSTTFSPGVIGAVAPDTEGAFYLFSQSLHNVWRIDANGVVRTIVAQGNWGYKEQPIGWITPGYTSGAVIDSDGNLILADTYNNRVVRVNKAGRVTTVAGTGVPGFSGDDADARHAQLNRPSGVEINRGGEIFVSDTENHRVRKVARDGKITTVLGDGLSGYKGDGGIGALARLNRPQGLFLDPQGQLFIADYGNRRIRVFNGNYIQTFALAAGEIDTPIAIAPSQNGDIMVLSHQSSNIFMPVGNAWEPFLDTYLNLDSQNSSWVRFPRTIVRSSSGLMLDVGNGLLARVLSTKELNLLAGRLDNVNDAQPVFQNAFRMAVDKSENVYIADLNASRIFKVNTQGEVTTLLGNGLGVAETVRSSAPDVGIGLVAGIFASIDGAVLFTSIGLYPAVRKYSPSSGELINLVGTGRVNYIKAPIGDAPLVDLAGPFEVVQTSDGTVVFNENDQNRLMAVTPDGRVDYLIQPSLIKNPKCLCLDHNGDIAFVEAGGITVFKRGTGVKEVLYKQQDIGDDIKLSEVKGMAFDTNGGVFLASPKKVIHVRGLGSYSLVAGHGASLLNGSTRDDGLNAITDIRLSTNGHLYILETDRLKRISKDLLERI